MNSRPEYFPNQTRKKSPIPKLKRRLFHRLEKNPHILTHTGEIQDANFFVHCFGAPGIIGMEALSSPMPRLIQRR
jgi:hypothetical protein